MFYCNSLGHLSCTAKYFRAHHLLTAVNSEYWPSGSSLCHKLKEAQLEVNIGMKNKENKVQDNISNVTLVNDEKKRSKTHKTSKEKEEEKYLAPKRKPTVEEERRMVGKAL